MNGVVLLCRVVDDVDGPLVVGRRVVDAGGDEEESVSYTHLTLPTNREV